MFLSRRITFWTGTVASYRAPVDVNMSGHGTSKVDDKADTNSLYGQAVFRILHTAHALTTRTSNIRLYGSQSALRDGSGMLIQEAKVSSLGI